VTRNSKNQGAQSLLKGILDQGFPDKTISDQIIGGYVGEAYSLPSCFCLARRIFPFPRSVSKPA
jgi:hypothetical protein